MNLDQLYADVSDRLIEAGMSKHSFTVERQFCGLNAVGRYRISVATEPGEGNGGYLIANGISRLMVYGVFLSQLQAYKAKRQEMQSA